MQALSTRRHAAKWVVLAFTLIFVQACSNGGYDRSGYDTGTIPAIAGGY